MNIAKSGPQNSTDASGDFDRQASARLAAIVQSSDDAIIGKSLDGIITDWNLSAERIFGYTAAEAVGRPISMLIPSNRQAEEAGILARVSAGERVEHFETVRRAKDGRLRHISLSVSPIRDADGVIIGASKFRDITSQKAIADALQESEDRYRNLFSAMSEGFCLCELLYDASGMPSDFLFLAANPAYAKSLGRTLEQITGKRVKEILPDVEPYWIEALCKPAMTGEAVRYTNYAKEVGRYFDVYAFSPEKGKFAALSMDVTERQLAKDAISSQAEALARSNVELERFAYIASHDLQEPLRTVISFAKLLESRHGNSLDGEAREYLQFITNGTSRMQTLIRDLMSYSRVDSSGSPFAAADCQLIIGRVRDSLRASIDAANAQITIDPLPTVIGDATQLGQVFQNLLANALKFRRDVPQTIHVSSRDAGDQWIFSVRDNGIGIAPQYFERIFIIFQRLHTIEEYAGTGIGLAVCKKIVERHHGRIWVESNAGEGSTFYFSISKKGI